MSVAAAGRNNACLLCQFTRPSKPARFSTSGSRASTGAFSTAMRVRDTQESSSSFSKSSQIQVQLYSPVDLFRSTFLAKRQRDLPGAAPRTKLFQKQDLITRIQYGDKEAISDRTSRDVLTAEILRAQLEACEHSKDFVRVIYTAFRNPEGARLITSPSMQQLFSQNLAKCKMRPQQRLITFNRMISYLRASKAPVSLELCFETLMQAASTNSVVAFRNILSHLWNRRRKSGELSVPSVFMPPFVVLRIIRALNRRQRTAMRYGNRMDNAIRELLYGNSAIPKHNRVRLRTFLPVSDNDITQAWVSLLEGYKMFAEIEMEWELKDARNEDTPLQRRELLLGLIRAHFQTGRVEQAWNVIHEYDTRKDGMLAKAIALDKQNIGQIFLNNFNTMPRDLSDSTLACIESQCTYTLKQKMKEIETDLGISWVASTAGDQMNGYHVLHDIEKLIGEDTSTT